MWKIILLYTSVVILVFPLIVYKCLKNSIYHDKRKKINKYIDIEDKDYDPKQILLKDTLIDDMIKYQFLKKLVIQKYHNHFVREIQEKMKNGKYTLGDINKYWIFLDI